MMVQIEGGVMSANLGRITVAYLPDSGTVRVVHSRTGEVIREDATEALNLQAFKAVVTRYKKMCEI